MRRFSLVFLMLCTAVTWARDDKTLENRYYIESEKDRPWEEIAVPMPDYPPADAQWLDLYVSNTHPARPKLMAQSVRIAPDNTVHYILNIQSLQGFNNITAEALHCPQISVKTFGYGDDVNRRWVVPKVSAWKTIGSVNENTDPVRHLLYRTFCEDGLPRNEAQMMERIRSRAMR